MGGTVQRCIRATALRQPNLRPRRPLCARVSGFAENFDPCPGDAGGHCERGGSARGKINDPSPNVRAAIIDTDPHPLAIVEIGYLDHGPEGQGSMRSCVEFAIVPLSAR